MFKNQSQKRAFLVEFNDGSDIIMYAYTAKELLSKLKNYDWESYLDVTDLTRQPSH